ncbi:MAG: type II toxin-antitoxin system HigB family toxin [Candidatus Cloacimonadales bacterium]
MRIIKRKTLKDFWTEHPNSESHLKSWFYEAKNSNWQSPSDIKAKYRNASILKNQRVVFNIRGNSYRLVVKIEYSLGIIFIRFLGTHEEYDKVNVEEI